MSEPARQTSRTLAEYAGIVARGFCMGAADVVPGVSGGTMAFILGIYEELIESIRGLASPAFVRPLARLRIKEALAVSNWKFLVSVGGGIILAILTLAKALEWLLLNHPVYIWSFFFGLVLASVVVVAKKIESWSGIAIWTAIIGTLAAWVLVGMVPVQTPSTWWFFFLAGACAICAMILPGISGAFILLILGKYQEVLSAVNERELVTIAWVGAGAAVGIVTFAQILGWLFRRYHDATIALLTGLMLGSLRKIWPWKETVETITDRHGAEVPVVERLVVPSFTVDGALNQEMLVALGLALAGMMAVIALDKVSSGGVDDGIEETA